MHETFTMDLNAFESLFRQDDDLPTAPCIHTSTTTAGSETFWAQRLPGTTLHLVSGLPAALGASRLPCCACESIQLPCDNPIQSSGMPELDLQSASAFFPSECGVAFESSIELDPSLLSTQIPETPDSLHTALQPWDLNSSTLAIPDLSFTEDYESTSSTTDYLDQADIDAITPMNGASFNDEELNLPHQGTDVYPSPDAQQTGTSSLKPDDWLPEDLQYIGFQDSSANWRCRHAGCAYDRTFVRACDLRKHYRSHLKFFFCNEPSCSTALTGFSTRKDLRRHMRSHNPDIICPEPGCGRKFGRADNMRLHHVKMHQSAKNSIFPRTCRRSSAKRR